MWRCTVYRDGGTRTTADRICAGARYCDISSKADRGDIFIVHNQKSSYRTPLTTTHVIATEGLHPPRSRVSHILRWMMDFSLPLE